MNTQAQYQAAYRQRRRKDSFLLRTYIPIEAAQKLRTIAGERTIKETIAALIENHAQEEEETAQC